MGWDAIGAIAGVVGVVFAAIPLLISWVNRRRKKDKSQLPSQPIGEVRNQSLADEVSSLLSKIYAKQVPLSQCIVEALPLARMAQDNVLLNFCESELTGWETGNLAETPKHRLVRGFISVYKLNIASTPYSPIDIYDRMANDNRFFESYFPIYQPVSVIESNLDIPADSVVMVNARWGMFHQMLKIQI